MDREKINDAADTAFLENYFPSATESPDPRWDMFADGFKQGADWLMQQPLSERLTEEEKDKIKKLYLTDEEIDGVKTAFGTYPVAAATITKNMLEQIFGADLFKEK